MQRKDLVALTHKGKASARSGFFYKVNIANTEISKSIIRYKIENAIRCQEIMVRIIILPAPYTIAPKVPSEGVILHSIFLSFCKACLFRSLFLNLHFYLRFKLLIAQDHLHLRKALCIFLIPGFSLDSAAL